MGNLQKHNSLISYTNSNDYMKLSGQFELLWIIWVAVMRRKQKLDNDTGMCGISSFRLSVNGKYTTMVKTATY